MAVPHRSLPDRNLTLHVLPSFNDFASAMMPTGRFVAMLICDAEQASVAEISRLARKLIDEGCVYFCCWGRDCERVHDIVDEELVGDGSGIGTHGLVMTTWHADDTFDEFIEFVLCDTIPDDEYADDCRTTVAVVIDDAGRASKIRKVFSAPQRFLQGRDA